MACRSVPEGLTAAGEGRKGCACVGCRMVEEGYGGQCLLSQLDLSSVPCSLFPLRAYCATGTCHILYVNYLLFSE